MKRVYAPADCGLLTVQFHTNQNGMSEVFHSYFISIRISFDEQHCWHLLKWEFLHIDCLGNMAPSCRSSKRSGSHDDRSYMTLNTSHDEWLFDYTQPKQLFKL